MSDVLTEIVIAEVGESISLYDASGQMAGKVDGKIVQYEFGSKLGWAERDRIYSVAFVWKENGGGFGSDGSEHACVLLRGDKARGTFDGGELAIALINRTIQLRKDNGGVYRVADDAL